MGENTQNDPQPTMWFVMRPQEGFEQIYQGRPHSTPIQLYPYEPEGAYPLESERLRNGYDSLLAHYLEVARGSTVMLLFPRVQGLQEVARDTWVPTTQQYTYQLRWRQRPLDDVILSKGQLRYSTSARFNVSGYQTQRRLIIPCSQGEVITPEYPENGNLNRAVYTQNGVKVVDQQGLYWDAFYREASDHLADVDDLALGASCYPIHYTRCDGDELGIVVYRTDEGSWDFTTNGSDWPFADTFGTGSYLQLGTNPVNHPINPGAGVYVATVARGTTP